YKLKVREAERLGMDQTEAFNSELQKIKEDLKKPFLSENAIQEVALENAYVRTGEMLKASHILIKFPPNAGTGDSLAVFRMAEKIKEEAVKGADFNQLAL